VYVVRVGAEGSGSPLVAGTSDVISKADCSSDNGAEGVVEGGAGTVGKAEAYAETGAEREAAEEAAEVAAASMADCSTRQRSMRVWRGDDMSSDRARDGSVCMIRSMTSNGRLGNISARKRKVESSDMSAAE